MTSSLAESLGVGHTSAGWAKDFLKGIGAPATPQNIEFVQKWENLESGGGGGQYNPLNSVLGAPGASSVNSVGVKNYTSYQQGLQASISTFTQTQWAGVLQGLKANNQQAAQNAINAEYATWKGGPIDILGTGATNVTGTAGGSATLDSSTSSSSSASDTDCLIKLPSTSVKIFGVGPTVGGQCLLERSQGRAILGATTLLLGGMIMLVGIGFIAIGSKPGRAISSAAIGAAAVA